MGQARDIKWRIKHKRVDDASRRSRIRTARRLIFEKGAAVDGNRIKALLGDWSYVPTAVSCLKINV